MLRIGVRNTLFGLLAAAAAPSSVFAEESESMLSHVEGKIIHMEDTAGQASAWSLCVVALEHVISGYRANGFDQSQIDQLEALKTAATGAITMTLVTDGLKRAATKQQVEATWNYALNEGVMGPVNSWNYVRDELGEDAVDNGLNSRLAATAVQCIANQDGMARYQAMFEQIYEAGYIPEQ
jgi:hypothetical protein